MTSAQTDRVTVPAADDMTLQVFIWHVAQRHPNCGSRTRANHEADHELNGATLDHYHRDEEQYHD